MTSITANTSAIDKSSQDAIFAAAGVARSNTTTASGVSATTGKSTLGQKDFIALMTAQLAYQDPFNPVDNTQMVAQMAQFSSVAGISEMNQTLSGISGRLNSTTATDAMGFVGRTVLTEGKTAYERTSGGIAGAVELTGDATDVNVSIADKDGRPVKNIQLGAQPAGEASYSWDGKDDAGNKIENGPYTVTVEAAKGSVIVDAASLVWAPVESASLPAGGSPVLNVTGLGTVDPAAVRKVA
ncbi:flagellar hook assembly protein FlgD [Sphingomonas phyllosphaerae]|uniref:flagellar hook assembly protein FlgD n=1 Tax=Sphingomonas phyllosphaerae TaxID=257003 RepID=UPI0024137CAE|nr:flagellar hook capping FlgD N-terminal domain-containing protein [Sphingomonas phyllosphaerae]